MPNTFLGFPVRRAMLADYALKTEAMASEYDDAGYYWGSLLESLDGFSASSSPADGVSIDYTGIQLATQLGGTDWANLQKAPVVLATALTWDKKAKWKSSITFAHSVESIGIIDVCMGYPDTARHVGFTVRAGKLYASVGNGSAETLSPALADWGSAGYFETHDLKVDYKITSCDFYLDGVLVATISTGLPSGATNANCLMRVYVRANASVKSVQAAVSYWKAWHEV